MLEDTMENSQLPVQQPIASSQTQDTSEETKTIVTVLLLIFAYLIGLIVMWVWPKWPRWVKIVITLPLLLAILGIVAAIALVGINPYERMRKAECSKQCMNNSNKDTCITSCLQEKLMETNKLNLQTSKRQQITEIKADIARLQVALELYHADNGSYPPNLSLLIPSHIQELQQNPSTNKDYVYALSQNKYTISTDLPDGTTYTVTSQE